MSESLNKCRWCGNEPHLIVDDSSKKFQYAYYCDGDDGHYAETGWRETEEEARKAWNKRYDVDDERIEKGIEK